MTYQGKVTNGVVVLDNGATLPDGTAVRVEPILETAAAQPQPGSLSAVLLKFAGTIDDLPEDLADNHDHYLYGTPKRR
jgi:hypothetical protein